MKTHLRNVMLCLVVLAGGCGGGDETESTMDNATVDDTNGGEGMANNTPDTTPPPRVETPPPPPAPARVRVIHASPDAATAAAAIYLDGNATPTITSLAYKAAAGYAEVPAGVHQVAIRPVAAAADSAPALEGPTPELAAGVSYTVIAHGLVAGTPALAMAAAADDGPAPEPDHAHIRFFHALVGVANVDICLPGATARAAGTPVFANVAYGAFGAASGEGAHGAYASVPAGAAATLQIRAANEATPCSGRQAGSVSITPTTGVWTAVAVGRATGRPAVAKELLLLSDGSTEVTTVAIGR